MKRGDAAIPLSGAPRRPPYSRRGPRIAAKRLKLAAKQLDVLKVLAEAQKPLSPGELARTARCTESPITSLRRRGLIRAHTGQVATARPEKRSRGDKSTWCSTPIRTCVADDSRRDERAPSPNDSHPRRNRQRQNRGLHPGDPGDDPFWAAGDRVGAGNQPDAADGRAVSPAVRRVAVLHSHFSDAERHTHWQRIAEGAVWVIVGARSAIFAPTPNLGLIVLDEEHESSFKRDGAPRYHARDVAAARAAAEGIPLVLGSATPSLESWHQAQTGQYAMVRMPRRVLDRPMPAVGTVDLRARRSPAPSRTAPSAGRCTPPCRPRSPTAGRSCCC